MKEILIDLNSVKELCKIFPWHEIENNGYKTIYVIIQTRYDTVVLYAEERIQNETKQ